MNISQYLEIISLDKNLFDSLVDYQVELISIYKDESSEEIYDLSSKEIKAISDKILNDLRVPKKSSEYICLDGVNLFKKPFNKLTLGEWIDIEYYISNNMVVEALIVLYRQKEDGGINEDKWEPYGNFIDKRKSLFLTLPYQDILGVLKDFTEFREQFISLNKDLFTVDQEEEDLSTLTKEQILEIKRIEKQEESKRKFAWEQLIMKLCNDDITKFNEVVTLPLILVFNILSMQKITG